METPEFECAYCRRKFKRRIEVHTQADNSVRGFRYMCCLCLGHPPLSCLNKYKRFGE
jgi:hypothetical protein